MFDLKEISDNARLGMHICKKINRIEIRKQIKFNTTWRMLTEIIIQPLITSKRNG